jgi:hypothetical protein
LPLAWADDGRNRRCEQLGACKKGGRTASLGQVCMHTSSYVAVRGACISAWFSGAVRDQTRHTASNMVWRSFSTSVVFCIVATLTASPARSAPTGTQQRSTGRLDRASDVFGFATPFFAHGMLLQRGCGTRGKRNTCTRTAHTRASITLHALCLQVLKDGMPPWVRERAPLCVCCSCNMHTCVCMHVHACKAVSL